MLRKPSQLVLACFMCLVGFAAVGAQEDPTQIDDDMTVEVTEDEAAPQRPGPVDKEAPFKQLPGRWIGEGRIGLGEGKMETVKCRATYFVNGGGNELKQNIRCASASGKIEVKSEVKAKGGHITGTWNELMYNVGGKMSGEVTERGYRIKVRSDDMTANMDVIVMNDRQLVEIQFFNSSLRGLTLILQRG
jgi:hypothetical protein